MTARTGMASLILAMRGLADAGTADWTNGTASYWDDDHVQDVLDRHRTDIRREPLTPYSQYTGAGTISYLEYRSQYGNIESGTAVFNLQDGPGATVGTANYSVDYNLGIVAFATDQGGSAFYMNARTYDLNAAAADIWRQKAGYYAKAFNFSTDNHQVSRGAIIANCLQMANYYERLAGSGSVEMLRSDCDAIE